MPPLADQSWVETPIAADYFVVTSQAQILPLKVVSRKDRGEAGVQLTLSPVVDLSRRPHLQGFYEAYYTRERESHMAEGRRQNVYTTLSGAVAYAAYLLQGRRQTLLAEARVAAKQHAALLRDGPVWLADLHKKAVLDETTPEG